ncbi:hypothetical protein BDV93DRAFT_590384 [Ceratobasidium sp. AG-I]|nr:hypothetical protein BDV93DRAFT_590384 [Ceratobasidium sp. AG-I]
MTVRTQKLAETKAKATVKNDQLDTPDSSTQATPPPARQRPRKSTKSKSSKSNSSKQALAQSELISRMPVEVFAEFASYLQPVDLISLARTNRFFRRILMSFSKGTRIWQTAERNIDGLPSCPPGLCEPQYAAFMFINACSVRVAKATLYSHRLTRIIRHSGMWRSYCPSYGSLLVGSPLPRLSRQTVSNVLPHFPPWVAS